LELLGRSLLLLGLFLAALGGILLLASHIPFLGRLPGDISLQRPGFSFYFPLATSLLISAALTLALNLILRLLR